MIDDYPDINAQLGAIIARLDALESLAESLTLRIDYVQEEHELRIERRRSEIRQLRNDHDGELELVNRELGRFQDALRRVSESSRFGRAF